MKIKKIPLPLKVIIAIGLGILCSLFFPEWLSRVFTTFNSIFENYLGFVIPLIIVGLVAPSIAELGKGAGKLLLITVAIAYISTVIAGYFSFVTCDWLYPKFLTPSTDITLANLENGTGIEPYFTIPMPPVFGVMTALVFSFVMGLGCSVLESSALKDVIKDFGDIIIKVIQKTIIPLLPLFIFGIFLKLSADGQVVFILKLFVKVIIVIFCIHIVWLLIQFCIAGAIAKKNPVKALITMLPAYFTALGTQSSAATIPVTLEQTKKNGVNPDLASFTVPLCATIHLSGSMLKIVACAFAIMFMMNMPITWGLYTNFIFLLAITMVAAPGVPGGAIMAALGVLSAVLGFDSTLNGLMIALYITMDSFGTACNVTGDGAIALIVDRIQKSRK